MNMRTWPALLAVLIGVALVATSPDATGQPDPKKEKEKEPEKKGPFGKGFGFGGPMGQTRKLVAKFDKDGDGRLNTEERKAAREFIKSDRGKGGFGKGGPGGPGGMMGNPFGFLTRAVTDAIDTDKDGKLTKAELVAGAKKLYAEIDKDKKNALTEEQLAEGLNRLMPEPRGFGGPPGKGKLDGGPK